MADVDVVAALRELVRQVVREELAKVRDEPGDGTQLLTTLEAATLARVKPATIRMWVREGLPSIKVGRQLRVRRGDLVEMLGQPRRRRDAQESPEARARRDALAVLGRASGRS